MVYCRNCGAEVEESDKFLAKNVGQIKKKLRLLKQSQNQQRSKKVWIPLGWAQPDPLPSSVLIIGKDCICNSRGNNMLIN